jgi:bifunctional oligoribonuclease and PAP phosphatase NrnA
MEQKLKQLIESSDSILVTTHISPDPDAVCSALLLAETLKANYASKKIHLVLEEQSNRDLSFLRGFNAIEYKNLNAAITEYSPQLIIMTDANNLNRVSRSDGDVVRQAIQADTTALAIIDHHEPADKEESAVYINNGFPAATQDVYKTLFVDCGLAKPDGFADTALFGILADTARFRFKNPKHRETFAVVSDLIDAGADIESLENKIEEYSKDQMLVLAQLAQNLATDTDYNYTFISDEFANDWKVTGKSKQDFKSGCELFVNGYIRNVAPNKWGFVIYQEMEAGERNYAVSFRALSGVKDVSQIARQLGGGGHKPAAGAKFHANSVEDALSKVKSAVEKTTAS